MRPSMLAISTSFSWFATSSRFGLPLLLSDCLLIACLANRSCSQASASRVLARGRVRRKQVVLFEKFDHVAVEIPRLFDLAGVAGAIKDFHLAAWNACFERSGARVSTILAAAQENGRAGNPRVVVVRVWFG